MDYAIGIDVGGSSVKGIVLDAKGVPHGKSINKPTTNESRDAHKDEITATTLAVINELLQHSYPSHETLRIGLGIAGIVSPDGIVVAAANSQDDYQGTNWRKFLLEHYSTKLNPQNLKIERDVIGGTVAEWQNHLDKSHGVVGSQDVLLNVVVGTGIGVGAVINGKILRGADNFSLEMGHIPVSYDAAKNGDPCATPIKGCFELYATNKAIAKYVRDAWDRKNEDVLKRHFRDRDRITKHDLGTLWKMAESGESAVSREAFSWAGEHLGLLLVTLIHTFNPRVMVLGGGVVETSPLFKDTAVEFAKQHSLEPCRRSLQFYSSGFGGMASARGFALVALGQTSIL